MQEVRTDRAVPVWVLCRIGACTTQFNQWSEVTRSQLQTSFIANSINFQGQTFKAIAFPGTRATALPLTGCVALQTAMAWALVSLDCTQEGAGDDFYLRGRLWLDLGLHCWAPSPLFHSPQFLTLPQYQMFYFEMSWLRRDDHGLPPIIALQLTCKGLINSSFLFEHRISSELGPSHLCRPHFTPASSHKPLISSHLLQ